MISIRAAAKLAEHWLEHNPQGEFMDAIQTIYIALFGRPADPAGLAYFRTETDDGANLGAIHDLSNQPEYLERFEGKSNAAVITDIYMALFGRNPELAGLTYFLEELNSGRQNINTIAINIAHGAQGADKTILENKIKAANLFTEALDDADELAAYRGTEAADFGRAFLKGVTADPATVPTKDAVDASIAAWMAGETDAEGTVDLTVDADVRTGNVFEAPVVTHHSAQNGETLNSVDKLTGAGDNPTLNAVLSGAQGVVAPTLNGVETINLTAIGAVGTTALDLRNATGVKEINNNYSTNSAEIRNITFVEGASISSNNTAWDASFTYSNESLAGANDKLAISLANNTSWVDVRSTGQNGIENVELSSVGGIANETWLGVQGLRSLTIDGDNDLTLQGGSTNFAVGDKSLTAVDASKLTGDLSMRLSDGLQDADVKFTGGTGNDVLNAGTGLTSGDDFDGGAGDDTLALTSNAGAYLNSKAAGDIKVKGFETLRLNTINNSTLDMAAFATPDDIKTLLFSTEASAVNASVRNLVGNKAITLQNIDNGLAGAFSFGTVNIDWANRSEILDQKVFLVSNDVTDGLTITSLNLGLGANAAENRLDTLTLDTSNAVGATNQITIDAIGTDSIKYLNVEGSTNLTITNALSDVIEEVDASTFTGDLSITFAGAVDNKIIIGGFGNDTLIGGDGADVIKAGAGNDRVEGGKGIDVIDLGTGDDTIVLTGWATPGTTWADRDIISNFEAGNRGDIAELDIVSAGSTGAAIFQNENIIGATITFDTSVSDILHITADLTGTNMLDGASLLSVIGGGTIDVQATNESGYLLTYAGGDAYLYYVQDANGDNTIDAGEIDAVGIFKGVALGSFNVADFDLV